MKKRFSVGVLTILVLLVLSGCESRQEPRYDYYWNEACLFAYETLEELFTQADVVVTGKVTHGNKTHVVGRERGESWSIDQAIEMADVVAELKVDKVYKGSLQKGDLIDIKQKNGSADYEYGGYLAYGSEYIVFLEDYGEWYQVQNSTCFTRLKDGVFDPFLNSSAAGEIKTPDELATRLEEILAYAVIRKALDN